MTSTIHFTPLSGAQNQGPQCHLLRLGNFRILLDCGWDEKFDVKEAHLQQLKRLAPQIDAILISHSSLHHLGALPYLIQHLKCTAPIYCTTPIWTMGETSLEEALLWNIQATKIFSENDIHETFKRINRVRYQERIYLGESKDVQIVPYAAGHTLGATVWKLSKETDDIVYAIDYNHRKEIICDAWNPDRLGHPSILITDSFMASNETKVKDSPKKIVEKSLETLRLGGNVLIPSDTAGRCFELMVHMERAWRQRPDQLSNFGLVFLSKMSLRSITSASNQLEWFSESFRKEHENQHSDPMTFEHVKILRKLSMLEGVKHPVCVIAATETLNSGFSLALFRMWGQHTANRIILTDKSILDSNVRKLINGQRQISVQFFKKVALQGEDLAEHERQKRANEEEAKQKAREAEQRKEVIEIRDEADAEQEMEAPSHEQLYLPENMRYHSQFPMFPCIERHHELSIYGIVADELIQKRNFMEDIQEIEDRAVRERDQEMQQQEEDIPFKIVEENVNIDVVCPVDYIEFSGRSNGTSIRNLIQQLRPRKLVLVHGTTQDSELLRKFCEEKKLCEQIEVPRENQVVDISLDTNMFKVKLREQLLADTRFVKAGTFDLGFIEGVYEYQKVEEPNQESELAAPGPEPMLFIAPRSVNKGHHTLLLGEIKQGQFATMLRNKGFKVKFKEGGGLIVNGKILITTNPVNIEGSLCKDYFELRKLVYGQFQVL